MRILFIHNRYRIRGGEDTVFEQEYLLAQQWAQTKQFVVHNKTGLAGAWQFISSIWNIRAAGKVVNMINEFKPDVIHLHNWHFALGPYVIRRINRLGIPVVHTISNFRLICPSGMMNHKGKIFDHSLKEAFPWSAIFNKVYRDSYLQTFWLAMIIRFHQWIGTWAMIDKFIFLSDFAKNLFLASGLNLKVEQATVKPNFTFPVKNSYSGDPLNNDFVYVGRFSEEKGILVLLEAFKHTTFNLKMAGSGSLVPLVEQMAAGNKHIQYLGNLNAKEINSLLQRSSVLLFPSLNFEGMPMTIIEALSNGTPVIASNLGVMPTMITNQYNGFLFEAGNAKSLCQQIERWKSLSENEKISFKHNARESYQMHYTPEQNAQLLKNIYQAAILEKQPIPEFNTVSHAPKKTHIIEPHVG
jgi:glycosyltransferase involved in cell wall biosynthesis